MAEHSAAVTVNAPVHQVYQLYSHFNDYPKFMTFVKEVTYLDDQRSHWVVDVAGKHEWDAVNEDWVPDRQIGWRSLDGVSNSGRVLFEPIGTQQTRVTVDVSSDRRRGSSGSSARCWAPAGTSNAGCSTIWAFRDDGRARAFRRVGSDVVVVPVPRRQRRREGSDDARSRTSRWG